ncbi:glucose-6-phosphate dehydrogenase [Aerococcus urinae]|uniref:glucose-6-phosphate dehydrogenase n=1 Tax=Aerococcus urinae TaxID=1376 RepID=UPI00227AB39E|nr:glucose-6-phosphate dehydrogenase [Aerococcus urinae]MCY3032702.1 glucose-6-phosphate dehydrogenase [Aerococcus urinae]MCY3048203.1 glucose-6-phosphate dehydrogenase [Aerococcus urinae]
MDQQVSGIIVLFGASGDLAQRKLYPSLFHLYQQGWLSQRFALIGTSRRPWTDEHYHEIIVESIINYTKDESLRAVAGEFAQHFYYISNDASQTEDYILLKDKMLDLQKQYQTDKNFLYYLSIAPSLFEITSHHLKKTGIIDIPGNHRVILEKPFGVDLASAQSLNQALNISFAESDIYRIDHYVGKESVLNIWATRQYNPFFEAIWNHNYIDHFQVTLSEDLPVGSRGGYYDQTGALLDMFQNHILQVISFVGMDLPNSQDDLHPKKEAFLREIPSFGLESVQTNIVRGQYGQAKDGSEPAYRDLEGVSEDSSTETFVAGKFRINNDRWQGTPFYFRTGKALSSGKYTTVEAVLKDNLSTCDSPNRMTFVITPEYGLEVSMNQKAFKGGFKPQTMRMLPDKEILESRVASESYEILIYYAFLGNQMLFTTWEELKEQWRIADSIKDAWLQLDPPAFPNYPAMTKGPEAAKDLIESDGRRWINPQY